MGTTDLAAKRLRVCHVVSSLDVGGMENGVVNLCNGHDRSMIEPMICCLKSIGAMAERLRPDVKVVCLGFPEGKEILRPWLVSRVFLKEEPDIVHTHGWGGGAWDGVIGARLAKCPVVINGEHGLLFARWHQIQMQRLVARCCSNIFSVSDPLKAKVARTLKIPADKIKVITNGVDVDKFHRKEAKPGLSVCQEEFGLGGETAVICSIGSLKREKNQLMVVKVVEKLIDSGLRCDPRLLLVGDGPDRRMLESYVEQKGLQGKVRFLGKREDVAQILSNTDIFVSTSFAEHEGLSNVILEAMASGLPVVATRSIGTEELVADGKTGFLVDADDIVSMSKRVELLIRNRKMAEHLGVEARRVVVESYSITKMIDEYEKEYQRLYFMSCKKPFHQAQ